MRGYLGLARPLNAGMSAVGVFVGGFVAVGPGAFLDVGVRLALAAVAAASFTAGGNALNDITDRATDAVNHPDRPLPAGRLSVGQARVFAAASFALAAALGALVSVWCLAIVLANALLMYAYESGLKVRGFPGNLTIAYLVGSLFVFAGFASYTGDATGDATRLSRVGVLAALAFLTTVGREVAKDIEDMAGDVDRRTLPQRIGARPAGVVAALAFAAGVAFSVVPWSFGLMAPAYAAIVVVADGMFIYAALRSATRPARAQRVAKYAMVVALAAFLAGGVR